MAGLSKGDGVYCEVRTESVYISQASSLLEVPAPMLANRTRIQTVLLLKTLLQIGIPNEIKFRIDIGDVFIDTILTLVSEVFFGPS
jgi:hypothetical protein